jgi:hypothetical protein
MKAANLRHFASEARKEPHEVWVMLIIIYKAWRLIRTVK